MKTFYLGVVDGQEVTVYAGPYTAMDAVVCEPVLQGILVEDHAPTIPPDVRIVLVDRPQNELGEGSYNREIDEVLATEPF